MKLPVIRLSGLTVLLILVSATVSIAQTKPAPKEIFRDSDGNLIRTTSPNGTVTSYTYDAAGNLTAVINPVGSNVIRTFDAGNRLLIEETYGSNENWSQVSHYTRYAYNTVGQLRYRVGPDGRVTEYRYQTSAVLDGEVEYEVKYLDDLYPVTASAITEADLNTWRDDPQRDKSRRSITRYVLDGRGNISRVIEYSGADASGNPTTTEGLSATSRRLNS